MAVVKHIVFQAIAWNFVIVYVSNNIFQPFVAVVQPPTQKVIQREGGRNYAHNMYEKRKLDLDEVWQLLVGDSSSSLR